MIRRSIGSSVSWALFAVPACLLAGSCGGAAQAPSPTTPEPVSEGRLPIQTLQGAPVFDRDGNEGSCAPPEDDCPPIAPDRDFLDACNLAGYRVQTCGCASMCTGKVGLGHFDAEGRQKPCPPAGQDCSPPSASAVFQDACTERGHRLVACGCEAWLCSGDPTK